MQVEIKLTHINPPYVVRVSKESLRALPGSILAQALGNDPDCKEITFDNPILKPRHLDIIAAMTRREDLTQFRSNQNTGETDDYAAAVYLNWMLLDVVCDGLLEEIKIFAPYVDIYRPETYGHLLLWSLYCGYDSLFEHILRVAEPGPLDVQAAAVALMYSRLTAFKVLLARGVHPGTAYTKPYILQIWRPNNLTIPSGTNNQLLRLAVACYIKVTRDEEETLPLVELLLRDERCHQNESLQNILRVAFDENDSKLAQLLLQLTPVDPNIMVSYEYMLSKHYHPILYAALNKGSIELAHVLIMCPRLKLSDRLRSYIQESISGGIDTSTYLDFLVTVREELGIDA